MNAKFCAKCGHVFGANEPSGRAWQLPIPNLGAPALLATIGGLIVCLLCALLIVTPNQPVVTETQIPTVIVHGTLATSTPNPLPSRPSTVLSSSVAPTPADALDRAKRGTVFIFVPRDSTPNSGPTGSGSVITKRGHILTNNHLFVDENGKPYNTRGEIYVGFPPRDNLKGRVEIQYRAVMVQADTQRDLALIRIVARSDGGPLPADLGLPAIPIGDSDKLDSGDQVTILGYPGLGGETLTLTRGTIAGFLPDDGYIKTDAEINPGNSGGPALNSFYEQIGIASAVFVSKSQTIPGKIGWIRPINFAESLIDIAKRAAGE